MIYHNLINLTPHVVRLRRFDGSEVVVQPTTPSARVKMKTGTICASTRGVPVFSAPTWDKVENLPDPAPDTLFIVSALVALAVPNRHDVVSPATGPEDGCVRDEHGQVWAVTRLICAKACKEGL